MCGRQLDKHGKFASLKSTPLGNIRLSE
jgi:hypothetical protein